MCSVSRLVLLKAFTFNFLAFFSEMDQVQIVRYLVKLAWQCVKHLWRLTKYVCILGPPQTRHLVFGNYLLSTTKCYRQLKKVVCEMSCRQLNAISWVVDNKAVSFFKKGNCLTVFSVCGNHWFSCWQVSKHDTHLSVRFAFWACVVNVSF